MKAHEDNECDAKDDGDGDCDDGEEYYGYYIHTSRCFILKMLVSMQPSNDDDDDTGESDESKTDARNYLQTIDRPRNWDEVHLSG